MKPICEMDRAEFGAYVFTLLKEQGVDLVLSGGSCVSIYTEEAYVSGDLDFVQLNLASRAIIESTMLSSGFTRENRYFKHSDSEFFIEFPGGPPSIGEAPIREFSKIETDSGELVLLTPTDCVKDRLAAYYHWGDEESLNQAILVARYQTIDFSSVENWSSSEGKLDVYNSIRSFFLNEVM